MDRVDDLVVLITEITRDHPLSETEVSALAYYADILGFSDTGRAYLEYCAVCDWLECTGRISPAERKALLALGDGAIKWIKDELYLSAAHGKLNEE